MKQATLGGVALSLPLSGCKSADTPPADTAGSDLSVPPSAKPVDWDAVAYNTKRGAAGFIPAKYMADITAPDGHKKHLGKHLPYVVELDPSKMVEGMLPIMWGNPDMGYAKHPNAPRSEANPEGHWYNWIRIAIDGEPDSEVETTFDNWPATSDAVNGRIVALDGDDPAAEDGKNTVYLAKLPAGASAGKSLRIWAHCLTHGEYVDFVSLA